MANNDLRNTTKKSRRDQLCSLRAVCNPLEIDKALN
jgi:hypothetical protein